MCKKWCFIAGALFALAVGMAIVVPALWPPTPGVTYANYSRLEMGMTREQVEALLGVPSLTSGVGGQWLQVRPPEERDKQPSWYYWRPEDRGDVLIQFDKNDRVNLATWNGWPEDRNGLEKLRDRLPGIAKNPPEAVPMCMK